MLQFSSVRSLSHSRPFATPWTAACQASLSHVSLWLTIQRRFHPQAKAIIREHGYKAEVIESIDEAKLKGKSFDTFVFSLHFYDQRHWTTGETSPMPRPLSYKHSLFGPPTTGHCCRLRRETKWARQFCSWRSLSPKRGKKYRNSHIQGQTETWHRKDTKHCGSSDEGKSIAYTLTSVRFTISGITETSQNHLMLFLS